MVEPDLGSSPVVPTSVADVAVTGTLVRPVASSSTGVPEETVESGAPTASSTTEVPSTTLFVLEDPPPTPIDIEADEQLRVVLTGDSITDQVAPYLQWILSQAATIEHRHLWGTALCDWFADSGDDLGLEYLELWEPHLYIVDHGGNGMTPCMADAAGLPLTGEAYTAKYLADTEYVVELASRTGSRVLLVDQPVSRAIFDRGPARSTGRCLADILVGWSASFPSGRRSPRVVSSSSRPPVRLTSRDASTVEGNYGSRHPMSTWRRSAHGVTRWPLWMSWSLRDGWMPNW